LAWDQFPPNLLMFIADWTSTLSITGIQTNIAVSRSRILSTNVDTLVAQTNFLIDSNNPSTTSFKTSTAALAVNATDPTIYLGLRTSGQILKVTRSGSNSTSPQLSVLANLASTSPFTMKLDPTTNSLVVFTNNTILDVNVASGFFNTLSGFTGPCYLTPLTGIPTVGFVNVSASTIPVLNSTSPSVLPVLNSTSPSTGPILSASAFPSSASASPIAPSLLPGQSLSVSPSPIVGISGSPSASPSPQQNLAGSASVAKSWLSFLF